jgi:hypothetical protein
MKAVSGRMTLKKTSLASASEFSTVFSTMVMAYLHSIGLHHSLVAT